jgi:FMN reductase
MGDTQKIVGISGNFTRPSRTFRLVEAIAVAMASKLGQEFACFDLLDAGSGLGSTYSRTGGPDSVERIFTAIEQCSVLVVGSPVYKASYSGLMKHLFDVLDMNALKRRPIIISATAKALQHALMLDHQMRPLFAFFGSYVAPTGIFVTDADYSPDGQYSERILNQIDAATSEALRLASP